MLCMTRIDAASYLGCQSHARLCNWASDPDTRMKQQAWTMRLWHEADAGADNLRSPEYQIVFRCRVSWYTMQCPCLAHIQSAGAIMQWLWETQPGLQIELLISVHITYCPPYCHRYWTHAWTNMGPLWHFRRGFMRVLYAISWCNCELNSLCNSFLIN